MPSSSQIVDCRTLSYGGLHTHLDTSSTFFIVGLFEEATVHPKYETRFQVGWIVHTSCPTCMAVQNPCSMDILIYK